MKSSILLSLIFLFGGSFLVSAQPPLGKPDKDFSTDEKPRPKFPRHWGKPPLFQTKDLVDLPGKFGKGSSTLARWIKENIKQDIEKKNSEIKKRNSEIKRPEKPEIPNDLKVKIDAVKQLEKAIHTEIKAQVEALGKEATREEIKATVEAFKEKNKQRFDEIKEDHALIKETLKANRPEKPQRPELDVDLKKEVQDLHAKRKEMHEAQKELHKNLKDASKEDRLEMIKAFKEANKEKHNDIKEQAKIVKEGIRALAESESGATRTSDL